MAAAVDDGGTDWSIARRRSLILSGKKEGKPYVKEDFTDCLNDVLEGLKNDVATFGPLAKNSEWCLTLKTDAAKDRVLSAGTLKVRGVTFHVRSADRTQLSARVHWAPSFIPDAAISKVLANYCKVQCITSETSIAKGFEGIPTGIRRLVLTGNKDEVPNTFNIINPVTDEKYELLVIVPGRSPLCFKCKQSGHYRRDCFTPSCRECGFFGHTTDAAISKVLANYCKVQCITSETSIAKGFEGIPTGIRRLVLTGNKDEVPNTFNIINPVTDEKYELLVIVPGRSPLCFKCKQSGHYRSDCFTPSCRECGVFGHTTESCAIANSSGIGGEERHRYGGGVDRRRRTVRVSGRWLGEARDRQWRLACLVRVTQLRVRWCP